MTGRVIAGREVGSATPLVLEPMPVGVNELLSSHRASEEERRVFDLVQRTETAKLVEEMVYTHFWQ